MPKVSIIIINYNYARYLPDAIGSALGQSYADCEIVVVDDGSTDHSREVIEKYGTEIEAIFKENGGGNSALNAGLEASTGDIICLLDADDVFAPSKVKQVVEVFEAHPDIGSCFHSLDMMDKEGVRFPATPLRPSGEHDFRARARRGAMPVVASATSALCFRRDLLDRMLPLPQDKRLPSMPDHYLKWVALALAPTFFDGAALSVQRVHDSNQYTGKTNESYVTVHTIIISSWMKNRFPKVLSTWADRVFADGLGRYWRAGEKPETLRQTIRDYRQGLSPAKSAQVTAQALASQWQLEKHAKSFLGAFKGSTKGT